jgi:hypothetical protein
MVLLGTDDTGLYLKSQLKLLGVIKLSVHTGQQPHIKPSLKVIGL